MESCLNYQHGHSPGELQAVEFHTNGRGGVKRLPEMTDDQWERACDLRKRVAERRMGDDDKDSAHGFFTQREIGEASMILYGNTSLNSLCRAENWLTGEAA